MNSRFQFSRLRFQPTQYIETLKMTSEFISKFETVKDSLDSKTEDLFEILVICLQGKDTEIRNLSNRVNYLEVKVNELERYSSKDCVIIQNLSMLHGNTIRDLLDLFNNVLGLDVSDYDMKASHPLGIVSRNQKTSVIVKFVYFETKNRVYGRKNFLKNVLNPVNKEPVYFTERQTKRFTRLL